MNRNWSALAVAAVVLTGCGGNEDNPADAPSADDLMLVSEVQKFAQGPPAVGDIERWVDASDREILAEAEEVCDDMTGNGVPATMEGAYRFSGGVRGTKVYELFVANKCPGLSVNVEAWYSSVPEYYRLENDPAYVEFFGL